jgi:hypothetical protein
MEEVYKDFSVIHADAERTLNLLRGLDEKLKKAIAATTPERGNGDRWYQFYGLRMNCLDCTAALLKQFDSEFAQDILRRAEVAITDEDEGDEVAIAQITPNLIKSLLVLSQALGTNNNAIPEGHRLGYPGGLEVSLKKLAALAQTEKLIRKKKDQKLERILRKIRFLVLPLISMSASADYETEDGDENADKNTLAEAAETILEDCLKELREAYIPF